MADDDVEEELMMIELGATEKFEKSIESVRMDLNSLRTGRANPAILDRVEVEYYGAPCSLKQLASIVTPDASTIMITPFDKSALGDIERGLMSSDVGITPSNDGTNIRLLIPMLTQDRRKELTKTASKLGEEGKVALRNIRRDANKQFGALKGSASEDAIAGYQGSIDDLTSKYSTDIDNIVKEKEAEIMKV